MRIGEPIDSTQAALDRPVLVDAMCVAVEVVGSRWDAGGDAPALAKLVGLQSHVFLYLVSGCHL